MCITRDEFPDETPIKPIHVDDEWGQKIGLTSNIFVPINRRSVDYPYGTVLYRKGDCMYIHSVEIWKNERGKGHVDRLIKTLWDIGFTVKVPNPTNRKFYERLKRDGFAEIEEREPQPETPPGSLQVVMVKEPPAGNPQIF